MNTLTNFNFYFMKKEFLQSKNVRHIFTLLLVFLFGLSPFFIKAQPLQEYRSDRDTLVGTSDTRLMTSIYETDSTVTMTIRAIGYMKADNIAFSVFYDPDKLVFCNENLTKTIDFGALDGDAAVRNPYFEDKSWMFEGLHKYAGIGTTLTDHVSGHATMNAILFELGLPFVTQDRLFTVNAGDVKTVLQFTFKKTDNVPLTESDFGLGVKTTGTMTGFYQPEFGHDGVFLWYKERPNPINAKVNPNIFLFRSGLNVETYILTPPATTSATISGTFWQGAENLPVSNTILDTIGYDTDGKAKLNHDAITKYGFIYTTEDVTMTIDEFSGLINIAGTNYPVPTSTEITDGLFVRDGKTFYIVIKGDNNGANENLPYDTTLTNLIPNQDYYAWAYTHYYFETSNTYQALGNRITFKTTDCVPLNIVTVYTVEEPNCDDNNGRIQMYVTGGSGTYVFSVNGSAFTKYPNNIITNLTAGTYTIAVKDTAQLACDSTVIDNVVLHNATTHLSVLLTATNAPTCGGEGALFVAVTGGSGNYSYKLNGTTPTIVDGWITQLPVNGYEMIVTDLGDNCVATSGKVHIYADDSQLAAEFEIITYPTCAANSGVIEFTVTGAANDAFTYQLDGYTAHFVENNDSTAIILRGLSAGIHYLYITDSCKQIVKEIVITNDNSNASFAFTPTSHNETLSCDGILLPGSITIVANNGIAPFEYSINGSNWLPLNDLTISGLHYGTYRIQVRDNSNPKCTYEVNNVTIGRDIYTPINVGTIFASKEPNCSASDGAIQVFATGGSGLYLYVVNGADPKYYPNGLITGLLAGSYTITVQDSLFKNCADATAAHIVLHNVNTDLNVTLAANDVQTCSDKGALFVTVTGGTGTYTYSLNGTVPTIEDGWITDLSPNEYELIVTDNGCVASSGKVRINATQHDLAVTGYVIEHATCGSSTGAYTFKVTNSNSTNYTYQLDGYAVESGSGSDSILFTGLSAGIHYLRIMDNCAEVVEKIEINNEGVEPFAFVATPTNEALACNNTLKTGSIALAISYGVSPFQYSINGSAWQPLVGNTISGLHQGTYRVQLMDDKGCTYEENQIVIGREIHTAIAIGTVLAYQDPTCGVNNGSVQVFATGGSGSYKYSTDGKTFTAYTNGIIPNLYAGTYTIWVQDASDNTCEAASIGNVVLYNTNSDLVVNVETEDASTCSTNGTLFISATGGSGYYSFYIDSLTNTPVNGLTVSKPVGGYVVYVKDNTTNCVASSKEVRINAEESELDVEVTVTKYVACGSSTGAVSVSVSNLNSEKYTYQLNGNPEVEEEGSTFVLTGLSAGKHTLRITDDCDEVITTFEINDGTTNAFAFKTTSIDEILPCTGTLIKGGIILTVSNGAPKFEYRIDGGEWTKFATDAQTDTIRNLAAGIYLVEVRDANGCTYQVNNVTIDREIHTAISIGTVFAYQEPTCNNANGKIQVFAHGGSGSYLYSIDGDEFKPYTDGIITGLAAGTYTIWVRDTGDYSCGEAFINNIVLHNSNTNLTVSIATEKAETCDDDSNGKLIVTATGGSGNYTYKVNGTTEVLTDGYILKPAGTYVVSVEDNDGGCVASSGEVRIDATSSNLLVAYTPESDASCGLATGAVTVSVSNFNNSYTYQLNGNPEVPASVTSFELTGLTAGEHHLRVTDGCDEKIVKITINNSGSLFSFAATAQKEFLNCNGNLVPGSINLSVTNGEPGFEYRVDGGAWIPFATNGRTETISDLHSGIYFIEVRDANRCTYQVNHVTILRETDFDSDLTAPSATTPQTFCENATVANLQATGANIKWYTTAEGGYPLPASTVLRHDSVYYAAQSAGLCQSATRTAVKVYIDPYAVLDTPQIATPQHFCSPATIADIATDGNTNIVWYDALTGGTKLELTHPLENDAIYYATLEAGNCQSAVRIAIEVKLDQVLPSKPDVNSPQSFCEGALIANIAVPNNQIVWYLDETDDTPLPATYPLADGITYYAAQKAGDCESADRTQVTVHLTAPEAPEAPETQFICKKHTLADLTITGTGIVWYDAQIDGNQLKLSDSLVVGKTYWAAQSSGNCESERVGITISNACYTVYGTVFPFVHGWGDADTLFNVKVSLHHVPTAGGDPIDAIRISKPVQSVIATLYDGSIHIPGTPKFPGEMGSADNPGKKISWGKINKIVGTVSDVVVAPGETPESNVGMYTFTNIVPGEYILEVLRPGFLTRWGKITINEDGMTLGHREIIAGDFNGDYAIRLNDISILNANYADKNNARYNATFDVDGSLDVGADDVGILIFNLGAFLNIYLETEEWINGD